MMRHTSRKFLLALAALVSASALVYVGSITAAVYGAVVGTLVTAYIVGNVAQKAITVEEE